MFYNNLKSFIKKFPNVWKLLTVFKDYLIKLSRLKDVITMMILFHIWPEQVYRFSTRRLLPSKKNRFSKESKPIIPYDLLKSKSSNIPKMKEINIVGRGSSFDLNNLKKISTPIFLVSFWCPLKINSNGNIFCTHYFSHKSGKFIGEKNSFTPKDLEEYLSNQTEDKDKDYKRKNVTYVNPRTNVMEQLTKNGHSVLSLEIYTMDKNGNYLSTKPKESSYLNMINNGQCNRISIAEKVYLPPVLAPHPDWVPAGSFLHALCALSYFAEKINVYGWDHFLDSSPEKMNYWQLFFSMYNYKADIQHWMGQFERGLINFYYGYQLSKLPNISIHGYMGQLEKHKKLVQRIERVLFN
jgi:hypothetical protein